MLLINKVILFSCFLNQPTITNLNSNNPLEMIINYLVSP